MAVKAGTRKSRSSPTAKATDAREVFSIRFSREEANILRRAASMRGATLAGFVREGAITLAHQPRARLLHSGVETAGIAKLSAAKLPEVCQPESDSTT